MTTLSDLAYDPPLASDEVICPKCRNPIIDSDPITLVADWIFHDECWDRMVEENTPEGIKTSCVYPPIPIRTHDWVAWYDSLGEDSSPYGYGETEAKAIADLTTNYPFEDYVK